MFSEVPSECGDNFGMRKIRIIFYKAQFQSWTDFVISGWTWLFNPFTGTYSHCEIGFQVQDDGAWRYFSSSIRDNGTRWKWGNEIFKNPERWDIYEGEYRKEVVMRMIERANSLQGKKYDVLGIFSFVTFTGQIFNKKDYFYCSEAVFLVLTGIWKKRISPRRLSKKISKVFKKVS